VIKIYKKSVLQFALKKLNKQNINELEKVVPMQPGIILTNLAPFKLYGKINKLKPSTFIKEGDIAQNDIEVKAGPTDLLPGPAISEFAKVKIPAGVEGGKIAVKKNTIVAKTGDIITSDIANILRKVKIQAGEVKLNVAVLYENGETFTRDVLKLIEEYPEKIKEAVNQALNLSIGIGYPTKKNVKFLLAKAYNQAKALEKIGGAS
jgi:large subunit ribosomal protein L10